MSSAQHDVNLPDVTRQLEFLRRSLADNEKSWSACGFSSVRNPVAESIREEIAEKEALLAR